MSGTRMTTLFLFLALSPFAIFDIDYALISRQLCKSNSLLNIFMTHVLGRNVEQEQRMCHVQEDNFGFLTFGIISPSSVLI